jgi:cell division protein FtsQ
MTTTWRRGSRPQGPIDPRIRERRIAVTRSQGRRRLRVLGAAVTTAALAGAGWGATRTPLLDVDRVLVVGADRSGPEAVASAAGVAPGRPMVAVDEGAAVRRVRGMPWVLRATVRRQWPATVRIEVVERVAVAVTRDDTGGWAVLDVSGRVLERAAERPAGLTALEGVPPAGRPGSRLGPSAAAALVVARSLGPHLGPRVAVVAAAPEGVELRLQPDAVVRLGAPEALDEKLRSVRTVLARVDPRTLATLDVRDPATPVLTRR